MNQLISTAIPYVNAPPHLGFALEVVLADAIARHARSRGRDVLLVSGTDDHSLKNVRAAEAAGLSTRAFVDAAAAKYHALDRLLGARFDAFVRTSADPRHRAAVAALWDACLRAGDLEKRSYRGHYCPGCEQFYELSELPDGVCLEHGTAPQVVAEDNWFFRLSRYQGRIAAALEHGVLRIHPESRANELRSFVASGLKDISVSRSHARARGWGIPVPGDPEQVVYVWFDALAYYLTALGFPDEPARVARHWHDAERRVHVVGKGIARFHAALWPALLLAAGLPLPTDLVVHGYLTVDGRKIGKSLGNAVPPDAIVDRFGADALRWFLLRHVGPANDGDVTDARLAAVYASELANGLGNLVARTLTLVRTGCAGSLPRASETQDRSGEALLSEAAALRGTIDRALERFAVDEALRASASLVQSANGHLAQTAPWALLRDRDDATDDGERSRLEARLHASLHAAVVALEALAVELAPFLPATAARIREALAHPSAPPPILFPRL